MVLTFIPISDREMMSMADSWRLSVVLPRIWLVTPCFGSIRMSRSVSQPSFFSIHPSLVALLRLHSTGLYRRRSASIEKARAIRDVMPLQFCVIQFHIFRFSHIKEAPGGGRAGQSNR